MAIYTAGRRRTILVLLLTSVLLITLDLKYMTMGRTTMVPIPISVTG